MGIKFTDYRVEVKDALGDAAIAFLYEVGGELASQTARNSRVKTGQTKGSWDYVVDEGELQATVGSPLENAIWEEFGTGEYAFRAMAEKAVGIMWMNTETDTSHTAKSRTGHCSMLIPH